MAAKGLFINSTEQGFTVRGTNNNFFPDNATLAYPANSVILITDDSDMATFRSASNYDVLFSALIKDININGERVTKDNIIETFNEAANKPMSNPDAFTDVKYDGTKSLIFYNDKGDEVANVDVTPFIKDGMVEDVEISDGNLVIHFNTDSDIKDIYIPLTEIFDPDAYYTKDEIDGQLSDIQDAIDEKEEVISTALNTLNENKADKTELPDFSTFATKTELNAKANSADLATVATSGSYNDLSDKPTIPTVPTNVSAFTNDAGYLTQHQSLADYYTKTEVDTALADYVDIDTYNSKELATAKALTQLNDTKADKTELPDVSTLATKTELNAKQDALVSGTNIKTVNNESILGAGNIEIKGGGGGMDEDTELLISSALVDLNDRKIDADEVKEKYQKKGDYATNTKVDTKANISDVPTNEDYEEAQKITSWSLNELNKRIVELEARVAQLEA